MGGLFFTREVKIVYIPSQLKGRPRERGVG